MDPDAVAFEVRRRHVRSLWQYLRSEDRKGLHVTDLVYGCPRYAAYVVEAREKGASRNLDEAAMIRLGLGKLLDSLPVGDWHHVDLAMELGGRTVVGQIDDIVYHDGTLVVVDKKTVMEKPPREAHDHYVRQVQIYIYMLTHGQIVNSEVGDVEALRSLVAAGVPILGAILYVDLTASTRTMISDVKLIDYKEENVVGFLKWMVKEIGSVRPRAAPSWFCHYCPIFAECWGGEDAGG